MRRRPDDDEKKHVPPPERPINRREGPGKGQAAAREEPRRDLDVGHKQAQARRRRGPEVEKRNGWPGHATRQGSTRVGLSK